FRKVLKQTVSRSMKAGAKGVRVAVAGRLGGAEMSRREWEREGRVPLHTLRADLEFGRAIAKTTYGTIGVKAWIYRGDIEPAPRQVSQNAPGGEARPDVLGAQAAPRPAGGPGGRGGPGRGHPPGPRRTDRRRSGGNALDAAAEAAQAPE